ncbi:hypothetical protein [Nostoc sp. NMS4]|uniref:hypothetical protein n=1 Tax=Nostoc sp. NMS4 TaxID=2815390 RepID=UPI0025F7D297|nr:hypothetical protein [Nostoc sp. NMS4]MBN3921966.1 hypothetical protein [Nostoc sp. NMS4]
MKKIVSSIVLGACAVFAPAAFLIAPALAQIPVPANQWIPTAQGEQGDIFSIDRGSIQTNGGAYSFWIHIDHAQGVVAVSRVHVIASCASDAFQYNWLLQANRQGQIIQNEKLETPVMQAAAGTVNAQLINAVCTNFSTDPQLAALTRATQTNAEAINRAMEAAAKMFR